jgi:hypothetical protein
MHGMLRKIGSIWWFFGFKPSFYLGSKIAWIFFSRESFRGVYKRWSSRWNNVPKMQKKKVYKNIRVNLRKNLVSGECHK